MSLSQDPAFSILKENFVCGYRDIEHEKWAGASGRHQIDGHAVDTTNGAGPHNIQIFVLSPDGTVLTCLPGYWCSEDLASELQLAEKLNGISQNPQLSYAQKCEQFQRLHIAHISEHGPLEQARSQLQWFDVQYEQKERSNSDFCTTAHHAFSLRGPAAADMKTTDVIMHERMARQPFVAYNDFNVKAFADYGQPMYDKHEDSLRVAHEHRRVRWSSGGRIGNYHPWGEALEQFGSR